MQPEEYSRMFSVEDTFWWYRGLRALLKETLIDLSKKKSEHRLQVIDAGCGTGANISECRMLIEGLGIDLAWEALVLARKRGLQHLVRGRIQELPVRDASCDVLMSIDVLYHRWIENDLQVLREYFRVLVPGGWLIIHVAAHEWLRGSHDEVVMTRHRYSRSELVEKVSAAGFRVRRATYRNTLLLPLMLLRRLITANTPVPVSDLRVPPRWLNETLYWVLWVENALLRVADFPTGGSLFVLAQRP
ncbi:MAG: methyltransferase domain-containing protein [Candidatus Sumerlaeaceae bacterium]